MHMLFHTTLSLNQSATDPALRLRRRHSKRKYELGIGEPFVDEI